MSPRLVGANAIHGKASHFVARAHPHSVAHLRHTRPFPWSHHKLSAPHPLLLNVRNNYKAHLLYARSLKWQSFLHDLGATKAAKSFAHPGDSFGSQARPVLVV